MTRSTGVYTRVTAFYRSVIQATTILGFVALSTGCGRPIYNIFNVPNSPAQPALEEILEVETTLTIFGGILTVRNVGDEPLIVRKVVINDKYVAENHVSSMGGKGPKFEPTQLELGNSVMLWLSGESPRPVKVSIETDRGTLVSKMKYNN